MLCLAEDSALILSFYFFVFRNLNLISMAAAIGAGNIHNSTDFAKNRQSSQQKLRSTNYRKFFPYTHLQTSQESANVCYKQGGSDYE